MKDCFFDVEQLICHSVQKNRNIELPAKRQALVAYSNMDSCLFQEVKGKIQELINKEQSSVKNYV